jgi:hypothetical protein
MLPSPLFPKPKLKSFLKPCLEPKKLWSPFFERFVKESGSIINNNIIDRLIDIIIYILTN